MDNKRIERIIETAKLFAEEMKTGLSIINLCPFKISLVDYDGEVVDVYPSTSHWGFGPLVVDVKNDHRTINGFMHFFKRCETRRGREIINILKCYLPPNTVLVGDKYIADVYPEVVCKDEFR